MKRKEKKTRKEEDEEKGELFCFSGTERRYHE